jgi:putative AlgH/UPF0301 family transcriptional regulator
MLWSPLLLAAWVGPLSVSRLTVAPRHGPLVCRGTKKEWARWLPADTPLGPGSVVSAAPGSFDHYFQDSLVLLIEHTEAKGTVGVLLNHQTPWTVAEMTPALADNFGNNPVFLGGDAGSDTMLMLHGLPLLEGARPLRAGDSTALCLGGVGAASELVASGQLLAAKFKFFYKTVEWLPGQLREQCNDGLFDQAELSQSLLLGQSGQKTMWAEVRELANRAEKEAAQESDTAIVPVIVGLPATRFAPAAFSLDTQRPVVGGPSPPAQSSKEASEATIADIVGHRVFKGNEQWHVVWTAAGQEQESTWETWDVLVAATAQSLTGKQLTERAEALRGGGV